LRFGQVFVDQNVDPTELGEVISKLNLKPPVIIKPNWGTINNYTEAEVIDGVLSAISGEAIVVESYGWARTKASLEGKGIGSMKKEDLRDSDEWFLNVSGVGDVLRKHGVEYLNVTEEVLAKRTVDPEVIRGLVEKKYPPVLFEEMYSWVPTRLFEMREGTFLSVAKYRLNHDPIVVSLTLKNLFGMIPGPSRSKYHGKKDIHLAQTIVDINKIYHALFTVKGVVDGVLTASRNILPKDAINPGTVKNKGMFYGSEDCVKLDALVAVVEGNDPSDIGYMKLAASHFGGWDEAELDQARKSGLRIFGDPD
jgi:uncharacterized protein (DUF362 family)